MQATQNVLKKFRELMTLKNIEIYVLPRTDQHQSQYLCPCDERVTFISGFTGSNAIALISQKQAFLWTDGRYFLQAEKELKEGWTMKKMLADEKKWFEHIVENYPKQTKVQVDGRLISASVAKDRSVYLKNNNFQVTFSSQNLIDEIWEDRPKSNATDIFLHEQWAGRSLEQKIGWVRDNIKQKQGNGALFTDLGQIAWILNLRSGQIPYNPFFKSILVVGINDGNLYLPQNHPSLGNQQVIYHLSKVNIQIKPYNAVYPQKLLCLASDLNYDIYSKLESPIQWKGIGLYRAVRSPTQIDGFRSCHVSDGIAMAKFWAWRSKLDRVDQYQAATYLDNLRFKQENNKGLSFVTISGGGPNAAVIHYHPTQTNSSMIQKNMIHLVDSGGQYLNGTTDVTRTFHFGQPTPQQKDSFTRVLLGNLDIERMRWPTTVPITGTELDVMARRHLWSKGLDFMHGTGHGVGYFEGVHEGPVGISKYNKVVFQPNMIVTNQPGYYEPGKYGIRIQNILVVVKDQNQLLTFDNLTLCPYDKNLLDEKLLTPQDKSYINAYHKRVWDQISPKIQDDKETLEWLKESTSPI